MKSKGMKGKTKEGKNITQRGSSKNEEKEDERESKGKKNNIFQVGKTKKGETMKRNRWKKKQ